MLSRLELPRSLGSGPINPIGSPTHRLILAPAKGLDEQPVLAGSRQTDYAVFPEEPWRAACGRPLPVFVTATLAFKFNVAEADSGCNRTDISGGIGPSLLSAWGC
jgi:hypothetical protein